MARKYIERLTLTDLRIGMAMQRRWISAPELSREMHYTPGTIRFSVYKLRKHFGDRLEQREGHGYRFWRRGERKEEV